MSPAPEPTRGSRTEVRPGARAQTRSLNTPTLPQARSPGTDHLTPAVRISKRVSVGTSPRTRSSPVARRRRGVGRHRRRRQIRSPALARERECRCACSRACSLRLASGPGCRSRGVGATGLGAHVAHARDDQGECGTELLDSGNAEAPPLGRARSAALDPPTLPIAQHRVARWARPL